jgi:hypothetical protein
VPHRVWSNVNAAIVGSLFLLLLGAASVSAATRFAATGGTATADSPCEESNPCSLFNAASAEAPNTALRANDEVVVEPGEYTDLSGDLGSNGVVQLQEGINLHGVAGQPRPTIVLEDPLSFFGALFITPNDKVSHIEIDTDVAPRDILVLGGRVEDIVARSSSDGPGTFVCDQHAGLIRNSACLSSGSNAVALGAEFTTIPNTFDTKLRSVTAVASGDRSTGLKYSIAGEADFTVDAIGVIAEGTAFDVRAAALSQPPHTPGTGAHVQVTLSHSDFSSTGMGSDSGNGVATISPTGPGTTNLTLPTLFAADGFHVLPTSPTVDEGAVDGESGDLDIDGEPRRTGLAPDIGADEQPGPSQPPATTTASALVCQPGAVETPQSTTCMATVENTSPNPDPPGGTVRFASNQPGLFSGLGACTLSNAGNGKATCQVTYTPTAAGSGEHEITASYSGDPNHEPSPGKAIFRLRYVAKTARDPGPPPNTSLRKKPRRRSANRFARFTFVADQAGSTFECKLDKKPFEPCRSPLRIRVGPGRHVFRVRAVSQDGRPDPTPAAFGWKVL